MKRRKCIVAGGGIILGGISPFLHQKPVISTDLKISDTPNSNPSKIDNIFIEFSEFRLLCQYINESDNPMEIDIQVSLDDQINTKKSLDTIEIDVQNGEVVDILNETSFSGISVPVDTKNSYLYGEVEVQIDIGSVIKTYKNSFSVRKSLPDLNGGVEDTVQIDQKDYRLHVFKTDDIFSVEDGEQVQADLLVVGGGGGGGGNRGGGGGAGELIHKTDYTISGDTTVTIGSGGQGGLNSDGQNGGKTKFGSLTADGGGGGGTQGNTGKDGGSGGGSGCKIDSNSGNSTSDAGVGSVGGKGGENTSRTGSAGGGGGASGSGLQPKTKYREYNQLGHGGSGKDLTDTFGKKYGKDGKFAGGGGGGPEGHCFSIDTSDINSDRALGRAGGGNSAPIQDGGTCSSSSYNQLDGEDAEPNTGSGGGGGNYSDSRSTEGGKGGSGIVIVRIGPI